MLTYNFAGDTWDISEPEFLNWVRRSAHGLLSWAHTLNNMVMSGFPDVKGWVNQGSIVEPLTEQLEQIDDQELRTLLKRQQELFKQLYFLNEQAVAHVAQHFGLDPSARNKLSYRLRSLTNNQGAVWSGEPEYHALQRTAIRLFDRIWHLDQEINQRIKALVEELGSTYNDPALGYTPIPNPRQAFIAALNAPEAATSNEYVQHIKSAMHDLLGDLTDEENNEK
jgi:hypothetical protein